MLKDINLIKFAKKFLGDYHWDYARKTTKEELELFKKNNIKSNKSYLVLGTPDVLNKFQAFYLTRCIKDKPDYKQFHLDSYVDAIFSDTMDESGLGIDVDLIFIYKNDCEFPSEKAESTICNAVLNKITNRNRDGLSTVILTEMQLPMLQKSKELEFINLLKLVRNSGLGLSEALKSIKK